MKPRKSPQNAPDRDLFQQPLDELIKLNHSLVKLANIIDWEAIDADLSVYFHNNKAGNVALPTRLIVGLFYLQHTFNLSDERVCESWSENPYWQYFCGEKYFQTELPCHPTSLVKWRKRLGEEGCQKLLIHCVQTVKNAGYLPEKDLKSVIVDTTVRENNITFPTDSKLLNKVRQKLVLMANKHEIPLRQNYNRVAKKLTIKIGRYAHAKQFKRMNKNLKQLKNYVGRVVRDIERKTVNSTPEVQASFTVLLKQARQLLSQTKKSPNKLYSLHEPQTSCICKGKAHKTYEFGSKAGIATTHKSNWIVGALGFSGNPYDGHTLQQQLNQVITITGIQPEYCYVDQGYKKHGVTEVKVCITGSRSKTTTERKKLNQRSKIEPVIGHMKSDGKLRRNFLKGEVGDAINPILCACGSNIRKLLRLLRLFCLYIFCRLMIVVFLN